mmetsp:Transcript_57598/g.135552  ORF Transcript_57598/g.135552 Transcript_57598/m.135552 type:complete len:230 (+) Transcript_57598:647-1336(+)
MAAPPEVLGSGLTSTRSCCTTSGSAVLCACPGMIVDPSRSPATEASPKEFLLIWSAKPESGPWVLLATESLYLSEPPSLTTLPRIIMPFPATVPRISGSELSIPAVDGAEAAGAFGAGAPPPMRSSRSPPPPEGLAGAAGLESIESKSSRPLLPPPPLPRPRLLRLLLLRLLLPLPALLPRLLLLRLLLLRVLLAADPRASLRTPSLSPQPAPRSRAHAATASRSTAEA